MAAETTETYTFQPGKRSMFSAKHKKVKISKGFKKFVRNTSRQRRFSKR